MVGTEYKWLRPEKLPHWEVAIRGEYLYGQNAVPHATFNPQVADDNNHSVSVGPGLLSKDTGGFLGLLECGKRAGEVLNTGGC
jgi:hypothetical protein